MAKAKIVWIRPENGGKVKIPAIGFRFYPMIKMDSENDSINWSFSLINKQFIHNDETLSDIGFLMDNAPHYLLQSGAKFSLYEGSKKIANGEII